MKLCFEKKGEIVIGKWSMFFVQTFLDWIEQIDKIGFSDLAIHGRIIYTFFNNCDIHVPQAVTWKVEVVASWLICLLAFYISYVLAYAIL